MNNAARNDADQNEKIDFVELLIRSPRDRVNAAIENNPSDKKYPFCNGDYDETKLDRDDIILETRIFFLATSLTPLFKQ